MKAMKKLTGIKIIKRQNHEAAAAATVPQPEREIKINSFFDRRAERELATRVKGWVSERRKQKRTEDIANLRRVFGDIEFSPSAS